MKETTFEEQSSLKIFSLGIVVKSEDPVTKEIQVSPIETMNVQQPGIISQNKIEFRGSHPDAKGVSVTGNVKAENYVKAKWICIGTSNRVSSPSVYPNETVLLFRYSNNDLYYWTSIFHEPELRKKEAATFGISNLSVAKGWTGNTPIAYTKDTGYWLNIDAIKKIVAFTTPDNDGEFAKYTFEIDVAKSTLTINDNKKNVIKIDSKKGIEITSDLKTIIKGKTAVDVESSSVINLTAPNVIVSGNLTVKGKLSASGLALTGSANISGDITCGTVFCKAVVTSGSNKKVDSIVANIAGSSNGTMVYDGTNVSKTTPSTASNVTAQLSYASSAYNVSNTGISINGGVTTYMGNSYINANGDQIHEASGTIIRSSSDLKTELQNLKGTISQAAYDSRLTYLTTPTAMVNGALTVVESNAAVAAETAKVSAATAAATEIATLNQAYQVFLTNRQMQINGDPDSQAAKNAISNIPSINPNQNPEFITFYNSPAGAAAVATLPPRPPVEVDTPLATALRALQT